MKLDEIRNKMMELADFYDVVALRAQDEPFTVGEKLDNSFVWVDGEPTDEELRGTCGLSTEYIHLIGIYPFDHIAIIAGDMAGWGADEGEVVVEGAEVVGIVK